MTTTTASAPPEFLSAEVEDALGEIIYPEDYFGPGTAISYGNAVDNIFTACFTEDDESEPDYSTYSEDLEGFVWGLLRQRDLLFVALEANHIYAKAEGIHELIKQMGVDTFKKMILYCAGKRDYAQSEHNRQFFTLANFEAACRLVKILPEEWKERGAKFVEVYAGNYFENEFKGQKL